MNLGARTVITALLCFYNWVMTSFGWKRKRSLQTSVAATFTQQEEEEEEELTEESVDWLTAAKRRRALLLEDAIAKSKRLQEEGEILAENKRYWEALKYWDEALQLTPDSAVLYEMKSQVLLELEEVFPAVQAAEKAVELAPTWAIARQTLGRAQLGLGEVYMALQTFKKALHLDPQNNEIREEDLKWAQELVKQKEAMKEQPKAEEDGSERDRQ